MKPESFNQKNYRVGYMQGRTDFKKELMCRIGMLRQWLNERPTDFRGDTKLVTNEDIIHWLELK